MLKELATSLMGTREVSFRHGERASRPPCIDQGATHLISSIEPSAFNRARSGQGDAPPTTLPHPTPILLICIQH